MSADGRGLWNHAKEYWRSYLLIWIFPVFFLIVSVTSLNPGHRALVDWLLVTPLFFVAGWRAVRPWLTRKVGYWPSVFWGMLVPFFIWIVAVTFRLVALAALGHEQAP